MLKKPCKDPLAQLAVLDLSVTENCISDSVLALVEGYNYAINHLRRLLLGEDLYDSLKFGLLLYVGAILTNTSVLVGICWVLSFVLPKLYEDNQDCFDELFEKVMKQYETIDQKIGAFFPKSPAAEQVEVINFEEE